MCVFSLSDINKVLNGPFKELKKNSETWINPEPVPTPRPGEVLNQETPLFMKKNVIKLFIYFSFSPHSVVFEQ